ncbi:MAG: hypothetical protein PHS57_02630 [Alphaproteobacteria bacterium]|nr:hypothetical protein [Alphaproteobacteria bacterium]
MQVPVIPPPLVSNALSQEIAAQAAPTHQAVQPLSQNAVDPTPKAENVDKVNRKKEDDGREERRKRRAMEGKSDDDQEDAHTVDLSI